MEEPPSLQSIVERHLLVVSPGKSGPIDRASCWRVVEVSPASPAGRLGLVPGDLLVSVDGRALDVHPRDLPLDPATERRYRFRRPDGSFTDVLATGADLGARWAPTVERLVATWDPIEGDVLDLTELWEARAWEALEDLAWRACQRRRAGPGLLARFQRLEHPESPAAVFLGVALWEQGKRDQGAALVAEWLEQATEPAAVAALGWLYVARQEQADGRHGRAVLALRESLARHRLEAAVGFLAQWADETVPSDRGVFLGRPFPSAYELPPLDVDPEAVDVVSFDAALSDLAPGQVLIVCLSGRERGSAACNELVLRFVSHAYAVPERVAGMHVIVGQAERAPGVDHWVGEDLARADGLPLLVLLDETDKVGENLGNPETPRVYVVDGRGVVVHEGGLDGPAMWDALAAASGAGGAEVRR